MEEWNRENYFDILRVFATFAVMILHVAAQNWYTTNINSFEWNTFNFYNSIVRWCVPIFIMISGALFLNKNQSIKKIYDKYIFRIVTSFIFWSAIYTILYCQTTEVKNILSYYIKGHYHMWFLFMIVGLYIITPFLKKITESDPLTKYFIVLALIFTIVIPQVVSIISIKSPYIGNLIEVVVGEVNLHLVLGYSLYFILGYYLDKIYINDKLFKWICFFGICGFVLTIILTITISQYWKQPNFLFYDYFTINVLLESILVFTIFKKYFKKINLNLKIKNILYKLSKYSYGAYLVHILVIDYLNYILNLNTLTFNAFISVPIIGILVFCISFAISAIINHIPVLKRYIV